MINTSTICNKKYKKIILLKYLCVLVFHIIFHMQVICSTATSLHLFKIVIIFINDSKSHKYATNKTMIQNRNDLHHLQIKTR